MKYYLGLDNGGTLTKATVYTSDGCDMGTASVSTAMITPFPGFVERDMGEMKAANFEVIRSVLKKSGVDPRNIAGVAVCGHGKGLYLWGKDGHPVRNGIISTDNRAWEYPVRWKNDGTEEKVFQISCQHILASQPVSLLAWLRDNEPESFEKIKWIFECKDLVRFYLTGEARAELTDYSGANLINLHTREYDDALLKLFGLSSLRNALPPLCQSMQNCGGITQEAAEATGLLPGTPVAGGMFDIDACAMAVDITDEAHICAVAGTWSINEYIRPEPVMDGSVLLNSLYCMPGYYLVEESSPTSAGNNAWFIKTLLPELKKIKEAEGKTLYSEVDAWVEAIPPEELTPVFLPFLLASNVRANAMGGFIGLSAYHTRGHLVRSVYEGIVFSHKYHIDKLLKTRKEPPKSIRLAGGVANAKVWVQMFADVLQLPIEVVGVKETGTLGCAIAAAVAAGEYPDYKTATRNMCRISPAVLPDRSKADIYAKKYGMYLKVIDALDCVWDDMSKMQTEGTKNA